MLVLYTLHRSLGDPVDWFQFRTRAASRLVSLFHPKHRDVIYIKRHFILCGFFCIVLNLINHRLCGTERGSDGSHQDSINVLKCVTFTHLHPYMCGSCGFFCIVLNLVDNREWVGWVGLLPTLIGKPVDELENLAGSYFIEMFTDNYAI